MESHYGRGYRIRITGSGPLKWYANRVGEEFTGINLDPLGVVVILKHGLKDTFFHDPRGFLSVSPEHFEIVEEY